MSRVYRSMLLMSLASVGWGCSPTEDPMIAQHRQKIILASEPDQAVSLTQAKSMLTEESDIVLLGRVGSGQLDPFEKGIASFVLSEALADDHGDNDGHDASDCPFCKRRAAEAPIATIELHDDNGKPIAVSADKLLGLTKGQTVVVQGRGIYLADVDTLQIKAGKLFIRLPKQ